MMLILLLPYQNAGGRTLQPGQLLEVDAAETIKLLDEGIAEVYTLPSEPKKTTEPKRKRKRKPKK